jgi:hypothetical protein
VLHFHSGSLETLEASGGDSMGVTVAGHEPGNPGCEHRIDAGGSAALMVAGLQGDVEGSAPGTGASGAEGFDLGVRPSDLPVPAASHDLFPLDHEGAHHGVG